VVEESSAFKDEIISQFRQLLKQAGEQGHMEEIEEEVMRKTLVQDAIDNALVDLIVVHNLPYRLVEWPEFHTFYMTLNPQAIDCLCRAHSTIPKVLTEFDKLHLKKSTENPEVILGGSRHYTKESPISSIKYLSIS
jgi:hypothetical protein